MSPFLLLSSGVLWRLACLSVCLSLRVHVRGTSRPKFTSFSLCACYCDRRSVLIWRRCSTLCNSVFLRMMSCFCTSVTGIGDAKWAYRLLKVTCLDFILPSARTHTVLPGVSTRLGWSLLSTLLCYSVSLLCFAVVRIIIFGYIKFVNIIVSLQWR